MRIGYVLLFALSCSDRSHFPQVGASMNEAAQSTPSFIAICGQTWMTRNLDVATYRNGDPIPHVTDPTAWVNLTTGGWCWYDNDSTSYAATYGRLYNWYAVNDIRGLAPNGWHVLTDTEWSVLTTCLGGDTAGSRMKEMSGGLWLDPIAAADNSSGFTGLPGGMRSDNGTFSRMGLSAVFWTSAEGSVSEAWCGRLIREFNATGVGYMNKADGNSVRCVRDP